MPSIYTQIIQNVKLNCATQFPFAQQYVRKFPYVNEAPADRPLPLLTISPERESQVGADMLATDPQGRTLVTPGYVHVRYPILVVLIGDGQEFNETGLYDWLDLRQQFMEQAYVPVLANVPEVFDADFEWEAAFDQRLLLESQYYVSAMRISYTARYPRNPQTV